MVSKSAIDARHLIAQALVAGAVGATTIDLYLWLTTALPVHESMLGIWQFIASTVVGKIALSSASYAWLGLFLHVCVSVGWAGGYAYLAAGRPYISQRWPISGVMYGIVVFFLMQIVLLVDNNFHLPPSFGAFLNALIAHALFFGLPVAFVVARLERTSGA
jgi:hypothetical protein